MSNPGKNVFFNFLKNSCKNKTDKFVTVDPDSWSVASVSSNINFSRLISRSDDDTPTLYPETPLKPLTHSVKKNLSCVIVYWPTTGFKAVTGSCGWVAVIILSTSTLWKPILVTLVLFLTKIVSSGSWTEDNVTMSFTAILVVFIPDMVVVNLTTLTPPVVTVSVLVVSFPS